jgi:hypothetical protein
MREEGNRRAACTTLELRHDSPIWSADMNAIDQVLNELVVANRVLSNENIVDAYGHVSIRHPDDPTRFFMARSLPPEMVEREDIMEFSVSDASPIGDDRQPCVERFIHSGIFEARQDVQAVVPAGRSGGLKPPGGGLSALTGHDTPCRNRDRADPRTCFFRVRLANSLGIVAPGNRSRPLAGT